jgi:hypothetical protein
MNTSGKLEKYERERRTEDGASKGMSESEIREWNSCLYSVAHLALDEFVPEFWKERLKYFSTAAESSKRVVENSAAPEAAGAGKHVATNSQPGKERKGDASLLAGKRAVNFKIAEQYLGLTERQRQNLVRDQILVVEGKGQNKKITTDSLKAYLPPENPN